MNKQISAKQTAYFCSVMLFASKLLILPSLFYDTDKKVSLFCLVILLAFDILTLFILIKIKEKIKNKSFFEFFSQKLGIFLTKIIFFFLLLFFFFKLVYLLQENFNFLKQALYSEASILVFLVCVLPVITSLAYKGLQAFGRTLEIFYFLILAGIVFCTFIWFAPSLNTGLYLFINNGTSAFFNCLYKFSFWFGDFLFLIIVFDNLDIKKSYKKYLLGFSIFSAVICLIFFTSFMYIYQNTSVLHTSAIIDLIQFSSEVGSVGKLDIFAIGTIMFILFFQCGMYLFCSKKCLNYLLDFKDDIKPLIILNILSFFFMFGFFNNSTMFVDFFSVKLVLFGTIIIYFLPIICIFLYFFTKKRQKFVNYSKIGGKK